MIEFAKSAQGSIGIEWELGLIDADTREFVACANDVLADLGEDGATGPIRREFMLNTLELVSGVHERVQDAIADIASSLARVQTAAKARGLRLLGCGTHPFSEAAKLPVQDAWRSQRVLEQSAYWARQLAIMGTHIHVGVADREDAVALTQSLARFFPYVLALSASSPYWEGEDTAFASQRTMLFQQLPTNGLPPAIYTWRDYLEYAKELEEVGMISQAQEIRWDVRLAPRFGTIENRAMDSVPTLKELGCLAALTQCYVEYAIRHVGEVDYLMPWLVAENKWRAARYGLDARVIVPRAFAQRQVDASKRILEWLDELSPIADELGCLEELSFGRELVEKGPSYLRQRAVAAERDLIAVVDHLADELDAGEPLWRGNRERRKALKPFLLITTRDHDEAAAAEVESVRRHAGLDSDDLVVLRAEQAPIGKLRVSDYSGIMLGGSPFSISDASKSSVQRRVEKELALLVQEVVDKDVPFFGMCYGIGVLTQSLGGVVDRTYGEPVGPISISLTPEGEADPVLDGIGSRFSAFVGHKEACTSMPDDAVLLASGSECPVQMYRVKNNVYVTQFHPELDAEDIIARMTIYRHAGYFAPEELDELAAIVRAATDIAPSHKLLANFVRVHSRG